MIQDLRIDFSHHAYCFEGSPTSLKERLLDILNKKLHFKTKANPDFWLEEFETFGINDGKRISELQIRQPLAKERKVIVIFANSITTEAQNALLKTFEEPVGRSHFFLVVPSVEILLPTLRSRFNIFSRSNLEDPYELDLGETFLRASKKERLEIAKKIAEDKDKRKAIELSNQLEKLIRAKVKIEKVNPEEMIFFETINKFRAYLNDRAPNLKMILEHIALIIPKV